MPPLPSCTSCLRTNSPTPSCCTIISRRTDRVVPDSAVSPAACSRKPKAASPATAAPHTGQTEECFPFPSSPKRLCVRARVCKAETKKQTERHTTLTMSNLGPPCPAPPTSTSPHKSFGFSLPPFSKLVVHVRYLCMYLYINIYILYM